MNVIVPFEGANPKCFISSIMAGQILSAFNIFNKLFVVILPILFIIYAIFKIIFMSVMKLIIKRRKE